MRTIAVVNQKGGCGKTITSINLAAFLAITQKKVLLVDMDPQGHATLGLTQAFQPERTMYDVFVRNADQPRLGLRDISFNVRENLDLAPADVFLSTVPEILAGVPGRENILSEAFTDIAELYDYVIVDCPPNVGVLTFNALKACSEAIVPMDPSFFSLHGIGKVMETFDVLAKQTGHFVDARVLITLYPGRSPFVKAVMDDIQKHLTDRYFQTVIRYSVKLAEAASHGRPIAHYCRQCAGYEDYRSLTTEVVQREVKTPAVEKRPGSLWPSMVTVTPEGTVFTIEAPDAERVQLVGDFNGWSTGESDMEHVGRFWRKVVSLHPGRYQYRFVIDGVWQSDSINVYGEASPDGQNTVAVMGENTLAKSAGSAWN